MTITDFDEDTDLDLEDDDDLDESALVKRLRAQIKALSKKAKQVDDLQEKVSKFERRDLVKDAGIELDDDQAEAIFTKLERAGTTPTAEAVRELAVKFKWAEPPAPDVPDEDLDAQDRIAAATTGAGAGQTGKDVITPADAADWPADKWARFRKQNPDAAEALKRGNEVRGVTF